MGSIVRKDRRLTYLNNRHAVVVLIECLGVAILEAGRLLMPNALLLILLLQFLPMIADVAMFIDNMHRLVHRFLVTIMGVLTICRDTYSVLARRSFASRCSHTGQICV